MIENDHTITRDYINLAAFHPGTRVLGPGLRVALWVQGCVFNCPGCIAPDWIPRKAANLIPVEQLVNIILQIPEFQGLTISGGEPMLQAEALYSLVTEIRKIRPIDVICFTGFKYEVLLNKASHTGIRKFLTQIDLLVDGPYMLEKNDGKGLRGSSNQRFIFLSERFRGLDFENYPRDMEIRIEKEHIFMVGIPPLAFADSYQMALERIERDIEAKI